MTILGEERRTNHESVGVALGVFFCFRKAPALPSPSIPCYETRARCTNWNAKCKMSYHPVIVFGNVRFLESFDKLFFSIVFPMSRNRFPTFDKPTWWKRSQSLNIPSKFPHFFLFHMAAEVTEQVAGPDLYLLRRRLLSNNLESPF